MKTLLLLVGACLAAALPLAARAQAAAIFPGAAASQQLAQDLGVERLPSLPPPLNTSDARNVSSLLQSGAVNTADILQTNFGGPRNQAAVLQAGVGNTLGLSQAGFNNQTDFDQLGNANQATLHQYGGNNAIKGSMAGNDNSLQVQQQGQNNSYSTQLSGNQGHYAIEQLGNNNSLTQRDPATTAPLPGYSLKMEGSNMHLTIEQGKVFP